MRVHAFLLSLALLGCDDPLAYPQDIDRLRVLGARASVAGDITRAWPLPGESVSLEWLVAAPDPSPNLGFAFTACVSQSSARGTPECAGPVFSSVVSASLSANAPRFDFVVPTDATDRVLVRGRICQDSLPQSVDESCASEGEAVLFEVFVSDPDRKNLNPSLADAALALGELPWAPALKPDDSACAPTDPLVKSGVERLIRVDLDETDREPLNDPSGLAPAREPLLLSHFSTRGHLARPLTVVEGDGTTATLSVPWRAPRDAAGTRVRFYFVLRDGRGGVDWSIRTLCLAP